MDIRPRKMAATVRYRPWRGSAAHIMFLASNICWVSSGTVRARYCWEPREVRGVNPVKKKWRRGNVAAAGGLIVVDVDALELKVGVAMVGTSGIDAMLVRDDFPE